MPQIYAVALVAAGVALTVLPVEAATKLVPPPDGSTEIVPDVAPGDEISIACAPIEHRDANSDVRVVLTIAAAPDESSPGFKKVLATEEQLGKYGVVVRIPDVPDLTDRTVNVNVYVVDGGPPQGCDAGRVKVVSHGVPDFRHDDTKAVHPS